jgi:hypothetical protein
MRDVCAVILILCCVSSVLSQTQQPRLVDGSPISVEGVLRLEQIGNSHYLVIHTAQAYEAVFDATDSKAVREIQVTLDGQGDALKRAIGQKVLVAGVVVLNEESPYYFNGALIQAKSIRLPGGSVLLPQTTPTPALPQNLTQFHALVTFTPKARDQFTYKAWDASGHFMPSSGVYLSCGLNGPGDVMNCFCPDGFNFTATGTIRDGHFIKTNGPQEGVTFAHFGLDEPVRNFFSAAVECTRTAHP